MVESALNQGGRAMDAIGFRRPCTPAVDVTEQPERVHVAVDLPGVLPDAIELSIVGNMLTVHGSYPASTAEGGQTHLSERPHGSFKRLIPLPASVNADDIRAESRHGVLYISVGKVETAKARRIPVSGASHADL
ncbi:MAG: Hsp20/alpha crystallin family protein [Planctomyces sp.]|nr:Hsp20/alpha crystallin family protein [Planctomyces sp.]